MASQQGDLSLLDHPVAKEMLVAPMPLRLSYTWPDGTPRVVPIGFHWDGKQVVMAGPPDAPKMNVLRKNPHVALTIDSNKPPFHVLMIRGKAEISVGDGTPVEYAMACDRIMGKEAAAAWLPQAAMLWPRFGRIAVTPQWVGIIDFEQRFPSKVEEAMARLMAAQGGAN